MSWTDEEIDKLVQESASAQQVEYKDAYWKEMEAMLDQKSSKKVGFWWWMTGCVLLLVGIGTYFTMKSSISSSSQAMNTNYVVSGSSTDETVLLNTENTTENTTENLSHEKGTNVQLADNLLPKEVQNNHSPVVPQKTVNTTGYKKSNTAFIVNESELYHIEGENVFAMNISESSSEKASQASENSVETNTSADLFEKNALANDVNAKSEDLGINELALMPWKNNLNAQLEPVTGDLKVFPRTRLGFYVGINGGIGQSYLVTKTNNDMYQLGVDAGLEYFRGPWSFGVGAGIKQQFLRNLELKDRRSYYSFGLINVNSNLSYDQLIFADMNLNVNYSFGKSSIGVAVTPNYLLGARLSYDQITQETIGYQTQTIDKTSVNHKYVSSKNFKQFGLNAGITYSYALPKNYLIQAEVNTRIVDKLLNSNFDGRASKLPLMLELGIKKRF